MKRHVHGESFEGMEESTSSVKPANSPPRGIRTNSDVVMGKFRRSMAPSGPEQCSECGEKIKILVSPKRNPHSSKLGRVVSMKDHDLCRRCWRKMLHRQRQRGVTVLPRSFFLRESKLRARLLVPIRPSLPREAS